MSWPDFLSVVFWHFGGTCSTGTLFSSGMASRCGWCGQLDLIDAPQFFSVVPYRGMPLLLCIVCGHQRKYLCALMGRAGRSTVRIFNAPACQNFWPGLPLSSVAGGKGLKTPATTSYLPAAPHPCPRKTAVIFRSVGFPPAHGLHRRNLCYSASG